MYSRGGLSLPGLWSKKRGVPESLGWPFTCVAFFTIVRFAAEGRFRRQNGFWQSLEVRLFYRAARFDMLSRVI